MSIIRVIKQQGRFLIANVEVFEDESLSFGARGLMAYLLTKPDHWQVRRDQLVNASPGGRVKLQRMINELKTAGYMRRYQENDPETGKFITITDVFEQRSLNPDSETTISGGPADTVTTKPDHGTVSMFPVDGKPVHIVNPDPVNTYNGNFKHRELDKDSLPPGAYVPPDPESIRTMISVLSGTCKGFANFLKGEKCQFYQTAIKLLENGYTEENVMLFRDWWKNNSYYEGQPSLTTLEQEIENAVKGVQKKNRGVDPEFVKAISELDLFLDRKMSAAELSPHVKQAIRAVGEGTIRKIGPKNRKSILRHFEDEFEKSRSGK